MSEALDQETQTYANALNEVLSTARELIEQNRIRGLTEPVQRGEEVAVYFDGNLSGEIHYLKPDYFLALFYEDTKVKSPDPYTERGLKDCQAWIFKYDRQHSRWSVEAFNAETGNRSFSQIAHRLATE
ncbi:unnamed protein product [marine sediment metagenome]|uniref:Uncharacterized protein n=2 Tax=marine sediment metagenome TaxID=412755 RepID=X1RW66_9ZZZZ